MEEEQVKQAPNTKYPCLSQQNAYDESSESDEDDYVDDHVFAEHKKQSLLKTGYRISVSAEAYGAFNKKEDYVPKVIAKNNDQVERLKARMEQSFMFAALEDKEQKIVIDDFEEKTFKFDWGNVGREIL